MAVAASAINNQVGTAGTATTLSFLRSASGLWQSFADTVDTFGFYNNAGTPESVIAADIGSLCMDTSAGVLYVKSTDTANTGWLALSFGGSALFWTEVTADTAMAIDNGYIANKVGTAMVGTLPATCAVGTKFAIAGKGATGWVLTAAAGQTINVGSAASSVAGTVSSSAQYDAIEIICVTADTTFVTRSMQGNLVVA